MGDRLARARLRKLGMRDDDLVAYRFGDDRPLETAPEYVGYDLYLRRVRPALNRPSMRTVTEDKWVFYRLMAGFSVPIPTTLGLLDPLFGVTWDGEPLRTSSDVLALLDRERPDDLVLKPAGGQQGYDVLILTEIDHETGVGVTRTGEKVVLGELLERLPGTTARGFPGHVLQRLVTQHPFLAAINPHTTNTLRVMTLVTTGGEVVVQAAILRLGRAGMTADNWEQGGVAVNVDLSTGVLDEGRIKPKHGGRRVSAHPDTGVEFQGRRLPMLEEALATCRRAARFVTGIRSVGWDVVLTEQGPVVLEANSDWDLQFVQLHVRGLAADPDFRREVELAGVPLPRRLPVNPLSVARPLARSRRLLRRLGRSAAAR